MKVVLSLVLFCCCLFLQGCAAVVVGSAAVATRSATDPRTVGTQVDDGTLELRVANALGNDLAIRSKVHVNEMAYQGKVLLTGQSPDQQLSAKAKQIAAAVPGTHEVYNGIRIAKKVDLSTASSDTWITMKVRSKLLTSDQVKSSNIKVTTENSEVFLMGLVTNEQGKAAADIASRVEGVKQVITAFTLIK